MTGDDFVLLGLGLLVGIALGAALVELLRRRPRSPREIRVTVARNAIPRRAATLSGDPFIGSRPPAAGGPADPRDRIVPAPISAPVPGAARTPVRGSSGGSGLALAGATGGPAPRMVAVPMGSGVDPLIDALRGRTRPPPADLEAAAVVPHRNAVFTLDTTRAAATARGSLAEPVAGSAVATSAFGRGEPARADADPLGGGPVSGAGPGGPSTGPGATVSPQPSTPTPGGPCDDQRRVADERCEVASRARVEAGRASDTLRAAQRSYDENLGRAEEAARAADPRTVRAAKDAAQQTFRVARANATTAEAVDAAARDWLLEINRINQETRAATAAAGRAQDAAHALAGSLERLSVEADAARIAAESAEEACLGARHALAECEEAATPEPPDAKHPTVPSGAPGGPWADDALAATSGPVADATPSALGAGTAPTIFRLLQGDHAALTDVVDRLAGDDPDQRRQWQLAISDLVDAILATAIEGAALEFPEDDAFWGPFTLGQSRDIVNALASLGYRFDGLGGWQDGRVPSQRDLSLALGYAGLDPMRMRHWPTETEMFELFSRVRVAAPEYLAESAGDLTLGELVSLLGRRAEPLADVWNAWGRIRPLLLEER